MSHLIKVKVPTIKIGSDADVAAKFNELFIEAQSATKRIVAFGLFAWHVKLVLLKHGQFLPWIKAHCPDITPRSVQGHMALAKSAMEAVGIKTLKPALQMRNTASHLPLWEIPLLPHAGELPESQQGFHAKLDQLLAGKSARQLFSEFKQAEDDGDGALKPKRGRLKGHGGASKEQRAAAAAAEEQARVLEMELAAKDFGKWMDEVSGANGIGKIGDKAFLAYFEKLESHWNFCRSLKASRKGQSGSDGGAR